MTFWTYHFADQPHLGETVATPNVALAKGRGRNADPSRSRTPLLAPIPSETFPLATLSLSSSGRPVSRSLASGHAVVLSPWLVSKLTTTISAASCSTEILDSLCGFFRGTTN